LSPRARAWPGTDPFTHPSTRALVARALEEDVGRGDVTTAVTLSPETEGEAVLVAREPCVVAGLPLLAIVYDVLASGGPAATVETLVREGASVPKGRRLARLRGSLATLLAGERVALNFVQQLSGVATLTRKFVEAVEGTGAAILDTRKTVPGMRLLQKYAVRLGGGRNHRFGLDDGILIKDNHVAACGSVGEAVRRARAAAPHGLRVEVECDRLEQVDEALEAGADVVLLDNLPPSAVQRARKRAAGRARIEVSGGIRLENVRRYAERGAELISVGRLTHSATAVDLSLEVTGRRGAPGE